MGPGSHFLLLLLLSPPLPLLLTLAWICTRAGRPSHYHPEDFYTGVRSPGGGGVGRQSRGGGGAQTSKPQVNCMNSFASLQAPALRMAWGWRIGKQKVSPITSTPLWASMARERGRSVAEALPAPPQARRNTKLTGLNRTWASAYLSARRTYRLGVLSAGRKYGLIRHPPLVLAEKMAGGTAVPSAGRLGRPKVQPYLRLADRPAESTAVPPAGRVGRPKVRFNPSPPLVVIPPYTNNPPPVY